MNYLSDLLLPMWSSIEIKAFKIYIANSAVCFLHFVTIFILKYNY